MKTLLIDGNSLINRAFYALPLLTAPDGTYTNAVYGFLKMFYSLVGELKPDAVVAAFDVHQPTFRHKRYDAYKAGRKPMPEELRPQIPLLQELLKKAGVCVCTCPGFEADDILGTYARQSDEANGECVILTGDRDALQLISAGTAVWLTKKGISETERLDEQSLLASYGLSPSQVVDLKGLMGDSSDNLPGIPGVGEKTALKLLAQYGTVEEVLAHAGDIPGKLGEKILAGRESAQESKFLATIVRTAPVQPALQDCLFRPAAPAALRELFEHYGFRSLLPASEKTPAVTEAYHGFSPRPERLAVLWREEEVLCAAEPGKQQSLSLAVNLLGEGCSPEQAAETLQAQCDTLLFWDVKDAAHRSGRFPQGRYEDASLAEYLLDAAGTSRTPEHTAEKYGVCPDAAGLLSLYEQQQKALKLAGEDVLYREIELPLARVLWDMEQTGFYADPAVLRSLGRDFSARIASLSDEICALAGHSFNLNSPKQLSDVLFGELGLPAKKKTKTGFSTDNDALEELDHPIIRPLLEYRMVQKLQSTYIDGMLALISPVDGRIHTTFRQTVAATGRLSSTEPNLQNIPVRTPEGRLIRKAFLPGRQDYVLVNADYSQIELRVLAHLSGDETLRDAFLKGEDIHTRTAAEVFGISPEAVTPAQRGAAKAVNFGIVYGISDFGLAKNIGVTRKEASAYIDAYFARYPKVRAYMESTVEEAKRTGYITTLLGRRRALPELSSRNYNIRSFGERAAMNAPIQGTAADIIKLAMLRVDAAIKKEGLRASLILQVHDELILEVHRDDAARAAALLEREMTYPLSVPLTVETHIGSSWFELK